MTELEFIAECEKRMIAPSLAIEDEGIVNALLERDKEKVLALLDNEF